MQQPWTRLAPTFALKHPCMARESIDAHGRLLGNLVIAGRGDPNLEGRIYDPQHEELMQQDIPVFMTQIAGQLVDRGVKSIVGDVVSDETLFLHEPHDPSWALENCFGATVRQSTLWRRRRTGSNLRFSPGRLREALRFCGQCLLNQGWYW